MKNEVLSAAKLYGILDLGYCERDRVEKCTEELIRGGVQILQLRAKGFAEADLLSLALRVRPLCQAHNVPLIINDHPAVAVEAGADGVHVGQDDLAVAEVRRLVGPSLLVGKSTHSLRQAKAAVEENPDYIGFGPLFSTPTKPDYIPVGLAEIGAVHAVVPFPVFCIGGIKLENLPIVLAAGARRVVIVSGLLQATDPVDYGTSCRSLLEAADVS
jgi:thiamine-phosphate pyrophosphorylase